MASSKDKALWAGAAFQSRTTAERKAYRAARKAERDAAQKTPEAIALQKQIDAYHAAWIARGIPKGE